MVPEGLKPLRSSTIPWCSFACGKNRIFGTCIKLFTDLQSDFSFHECLNRKSHGQLRYDPWRHGGRPVDRTTSSSRSEEYGCTLCALITIYSLVTQKVHFINLLRERIKLCIYSSEHNTHDQQLYSNWRIDIMRNLWRR